MTGFPLGPLVLYGSDVCGIVFDEGTARTCSSTVQNVYTVFVVDEDLAYASAANRVLRYDGNRWTQLGAPLDTEHTIQAIWASREVLVAATSAGDVHVYRDGATEPESQLGVSTSAVWALWGFGATDVWLGNEDGQLMHYDGEEWSSFWSQAGGCRSVRKLWGADQVLYFASSSYLGVWRDGQVQDVIDGPCEEQDAFMEGTYEELRILGLWGNAPDEVFVALEQRTIDQRITEDGLIRTSIPPDACGSVRLHWFDGATVGRL